MTASRAAFTFIDGKRWTGGYTYLLNLLGALSAYELDRVRPVLFAGTGVSENELRPFCQLAGVEIVRTPAVDAGHSRLEQALLLGLDTNAARQFQVEKIDVVFESAAFYGWRLPIPTIAWLPDFQHRRLRRYFGVRAFWRRELGFRAQVASGRRIMLSSEDARRDCERFYPSSIGRTEVVRFAVRIDEALLEPNPRKTADGYGLPEVFLYLPNQFWAHKNHAVVVESLGILKRNGRRVVVAATGNPLDPRHPDHFATLQRRIDALNLRESFRVLGMVPRAHVISLMRSSTALINPSYFEGWSSTVEEARSLGLPMLLSDIAVHREQMGAQATYFDATDPAALAATIESIFHGDAARASRAPRPLDDSRVRWFAHDFADVVERALGRL